MLKKVTSSPDAAVCGGLSRLDGRARNNTFIEDLELPHVLGGQLDAGYRAMAADPAREGEARE